MKTELPDWATVRYLHERAVDEPDGPVSPKGGVTYAVVFNGRDVVALGVAVCHPKENFNKRRAREIALGRALKNFKVGNRVTDTESLEPMRRAASLAYTEFLPMPRMRQLMEEAAHEA